MRKAKDIKDDSTSLTEEAVVIMEEQIEDAQEANKELKKEEK